MSNEWTNAPAGGYTRASATDESPPTLALAAGLVAALVGGAIWAAIAIYGNLEVGWVAWGIGVLVGGAMARTTALRSRKLAVMAAMLALLGLVAGKAMTFAGSAGPVAQEMVADDEYMRGMTAWEMYYDGTMAPELRSAVDETEARGDTLSDALWADMLAAADDRLAGMTEDERLDVAHAAAAGMVREVGLVNGVMMQVSAFDLLWLFLALATAYGMMNTPKEESGAVEAEAHSEAESEKEPLSVV